jgi:hypothetical protein
MASAPTIQASCQASRSAKTLILSNDYGLDAADYRALPEPYSHSKFAIRPILVRRTRIGQAGKSAS